MIYLAESGSTKTDAVILDDRGNEVKRFSHMGFNPYFHSSDLINTELDKIAEVQQYSGDIKKVFFYGAGCSAPHLNDIVAGGLQRSFPNAEIYVDHDLKASAYATYTGEPGITCILGTGSNSVYFDGKNISEEVPSLAFILGDEGSASYIGKKLITSYFYKRMPAKAAQEFEQTFTITKDGVIDRVYNQEHANVYLGSFAPFAHKHIHDPFFWEIVFTGFKQFLEIHVVCFKDAYNLPVHFVGSVAYYFQDILETVMEHMDLNKGQIIQKPLGNLIKYHQKYILNQPSPTPKTN